MPEFESVAVTSIIYAPPFGAVEGKRVVVTVPQPLIYTVQFAAADSPPGALHSVTDTGVPGATPAAGLLKPPLMSRFCDQRPGGAKHTTSARPDRARTPFRSIVAIFVFICFSFSFRLYLLLT